MAIDGFDPASVEHGELRAEVRALKDRIDIIEARQVVVMDSVATKKGERGMTVIIVSAVSVVIGLVINFANTIRNWVNHL
jgi:hypothetical protein